MNIYPRYLCLRSSTAILLGFLLSTVLLFPLPASAQQTQVQYLAALCDSGRTCLGRGDFEKARQFFEEALQLEEDFQPALRGLGRVFLDMEANATQALHYLRRATELVPTDPAAHYYRALAHLELEKSAPKMGHIRSALKELDMVLALDPSHPDANYRKGLVLFEKTREFEEAEAAIRRQIGANPAHNEARMLLLKIEMDRGLWNQAINTAEEIVGRDPEDAEAYPYLAGAYWKANRLEEAMGTFERYFSVAEEKERSLYLDLGLLLTPSEQEEFQNLDSQGRRAFWAHYWRTRDPNLKTDVNERLLEHYIRIAYARLEFGENIWPWDQRGDFYVRYGEPDYRSGPGMPVAWMMIDDDPVWIKNKRDFQEEVGMSSQFIEHSTFDNPFWDPPPGVEKHVVVALADSIRLEDPSLTYQELWDMASAEAEKRAVRGSISATNERWVYESRGIDLEFEDFTHNGNYDVYGVRSRALVEHMEEKVPTISEEEEKIDLIDPMDSVITFKGENGKTVVEYAFALLPDEFGAFRSATGSYAILHVEVNLYTDSWELVAEAGQQARRLRTVPQIQIRGIPLFVDATRMEVDPGEYLLTTMLLDPETGKRSTAEEVVELPDYSGDQLMVSNILPAARITQVEPGREGTFIRGDLEVLPLPGRALQVDQPLFIYYEIYNLAKDEFGATDYQIDYSVAEAPQEMALATRLFQGLRSLVGAGRKRAVITSSVSGSGISNDVRSFLEIDLSGLPPQTYEIELRITDLLKGSTATSYLLLRTLPAPK